MEPELSCQISAEPSAQYTKNNVDNHTISGPTHDPAGQPSGNTAK